MTATKSTLTLQQLEDVRKLCLPGTAWRLIIDETIANRYQIEAERQRADELQEKLNQQNKLSNMRAIQLSGGSAKSRLGSTLDLIRRAEKAEAEIAALQTDIKSYISINGELATEVEVLKAKLPNPVVHPTRAAGHSYASVAISARDEQWFTAINEAGFTVKGE